MKLKQIPEDFVVEELPGYKYGTGRFSIILMKKKEFTTLKAVNIVGEFLKSDIGYAGLKDKRGITSQYISARCSKDHVEKFKHPDIELKYISNGPRKIMLGDLKGNKFQIVVRDLDSVKVNDAPIKNYYDEQRFSKNNIEIGLAILKRDFKKAVELIDELSVQEYYKKNPTNPIGALRVLSKRHLALYIHSYQSKVFNEHIEGLEGDNREIPLAGFACEEPAIEKIIAKDGLTFRDFIIPELQGLSCEGGTRMLYVQPENLEIGSFEQDELNKGKKKVLVRFKLGKGQYATNVLKHLFPS